METESFEEFDKRIRNVHGERRSFKMNAHYSQESNKYYTAHRPKEKRFVVYKEPHSRIVRRCNELLIEHFINNGILRLPCGMGTIMLMDRGKFTLENKRKRVIDWTKTMKLWYEDEECWNNRMFVYGDDSFYHAEYSKKGANYKNNQYYQFYIHRPIQKKILEKVKQGIIDGYKKD